MLSVDWKAPDLLVVRALRSSPSPAAMGKPVLLTSTERTIGGQRAQAVMARARAALAARATLTEVRQAAGVISSSVTMTDDDEALEICTADNADRPCRSWTGCASSLTEAERAPLTLLWDTFSSLLPAPAPSGPPTELDRWALHRVWFASSDRRAWVHRELLRLASSVDVPGLAPALAPDLDAADPEVRILAVNALASATRKDFRRDSRGVLRPIEAVIADYRALLHGH